MPWLEVALVACVLIGVTAGTMLVVRSPTFWAGLAGAMWTAAIPAIVRVVTKRMTPEEERRFQECVRRGGEWDHRTKRCKR